MQQARNDREQHGTMNGRTALPRDVAAQDPTTAAPRRTVDFAVVVGIEDYPYFHPVLGAANDARAFRDWLCESGGGGLDPENVRLVLSDPEQETPAQDEIDRELVAVLDAARSCGGGRRLYFYFSGHGAMNPDRMRNDVALLLTRWSESLARLALSTEHYSSTLCSLGLFEEIAIFIDCCRSISASVVGVQPLFIPRQDTAPCQTRRFLAFATEARNLAFETPDAGRWHGLFTQCLLAILCKRENASIRADRLKGLLEAEVAQMARRRSLLQRAHVENGLPEDSCFGRERPTAARGGPSLLAALRRFARVLTRGAPIPTRSSSFDPKPRLELRFARRRGKIVVLSGDLRIVAESRASDKPLQLRLPVGLYQIQGGGQDAVRFIHDGWKVAHDV